MKPSSIILSFAAILFLGVPCFARSGAAPGLHGSFGGFRPGYLGAATMSGSTVRSFRPVRRYSFSQALDRGRGFFRPRRFRIYGYDIGYGFGYKPEYGFGYDRGYGRFSFNRRNNSAVDYIYGSNIFPVTQGYGQPYGYGLEGPLIITAPAYANVPEDQYPDAVPQRRSRVVEIGPACRPAQRHAITVYRGVWARVEHVC